MKKFVFLLIATGYIATGCNKSLLDSQPQDRYVESTFWVTPEPANAALVGCYSALRSNGVYGAAANSTLPLLR